MAQPHATWQEGHLTGPSNMAPDPQPPARRTSPRLTRDTLTTKTVLASSMSNLAPLMSFVFSFPVIVLGAGVGTTFVLVVVAVAILFHCNTSVQFVKVVPSAGSYISYLGRTFGPVTAMVTAALVVPGYVAYLASLLAVVGGWAARIAAVYFGVHVPWQPVTVICCLVIAYVVIAGVRLSTRWLVALLVVQIAAVLIGSVGVLVANARYVNWAAFDPANIKNGFAGIGVGFPIAIWIFTGIGNAQGLAEDTRAPRKSIPRAIYLSFVIDVFLILLMGWATTVGFHNSASAMSRASLPFISVTTATFGIGILSFLIFVGTWISTAAEAIAAANTEARQWFSASREGLLPRVLSRVGLRKTPWVSLGAHITAALAAVMVWGVFENRPFVLFGYLATLAGIPFVLMYLAINVALPIFYWRHARATMSWLWHGVLPVLGVLVMVPPLLSALSPSQPSPYRWFPLGYSVFIVLAVLWAWRRRRRHPELAHAAGSILADS